MGGCATGARLAPPQGIEAVSRGGGWWYLTWHPVPDATSYEYVNEFGQATTTATRSGLFAIPNGDNRTCRVRSMGEGGPSGWVTATITVDGTGKLVKLVIEGNGEPPPPDPPPVPTVRRVTVAHTSLAAWWTSPPDIDQWELRLVEEGGTSPGQAVMEPRVIINGLTPATRYGFTVRAVDTGTGARSEWSPTRWVRTLADGEPVRPDTPRNLRTHCITTTSAKAEWDTDPDVDFWLVWLDDDRDDELKTVTPLVRLQDLAPDTPYRVAVVAVREGVVSEVATHEFSTIVPLPPPDEDPPPDVGGDLPAPKHLHVTWRAAGTLEASWLDERPDSRDSSFYVVSVDGGRTQQRVDAATYTWTGLPNTTTTVLLYGVFVNRLTAPARAAASPQGAAE